MQYVLPVSLFLAAAITVPAQAVIFKAELKLPGVCGPRTELVSALKDEYSEATAVWSSSSPQKIPQPDIA